MDKQLKKILIKTKKEVFSSSVGNNIAKLKGEGYDFVELREYEEGEDIRKIDWMISAKMNKPFVKVFHVQKQLNINIVCLMNGSLHFGTKGFKQELLSEISSILGYATVANQDTFASFIANETIDINTNKSKSVHSVQEMTNKVFHYDCLKKEVNYKTIFKDIFNKIHKKSLIFLLGDFLNFDKIDLRLLAKKHQVIAVLVRDQFEESPKKIGNVHFVDPQSYNEFHGNLDSFTINKYKKMIESNDHELYKHFKECGIEFTKIYTHENPFVKLMKLFQ